MERPPRLELRPTDPSDLEWIVALEARPDVSRFITPWTHDEHRSVLDDDSWAHWMVEVKGDPTPCGFILLAGVNTTAIELRRLVVATPGLGLGRAVLRELKSIVLDRWDAGRFWLDVFDFNTRALALYRSEGFETVDSVSGASVGGPEGSELLILQVRRPDLPPGEGGE